MDDDDDDECDEMYFNLQLHLKYLVHFGQDSHHQVDPHFVLSCRLEIG